MANLHKKSWTVSNSGVETMEVDDKADSEVNTPVVERKEAEKRKRSSSRYVHVYFRFSGQVHLIVFCCIVAWIQPDNSGCQQDFLLSENEIIWEYFVVIAKTIFESFEKW